MIGFTRRIYRLPILVSLILLVSAAVVFSLHTIAQTQNAKQITNSLGMKFTTIPAGEFLMGATPDEIADRRAQLVKRGGDEDDGEEIKKEEIAITESEGPQHRVKITNDFLLGMYEVTQQDFQTVMGFNPSGHSATGKRKDRLTGLDTKRHPVDQVSWNDAVEFCKQLSSLDDEVAAGRTYRLPTEAEWEYACRAGTTTTYFWGSGKGKKESGDWTDYPKIGTGKRAMTVPIGSLKPNPWGLYDMSGNVREWCADWYDAQTYAKGAAQDPTGPTTGKERVIRGGMNFFFPPAYRSAARRKLAPDSVNLHIGFRVVCVQGPIPKAVPVEVAAAPIDALLKQKGLVRQGSFYVLAEGNDFARFASTLERMRVACFHAKREVEDAKTQLRHVSAAQAGALKARIDARSTMRYSDTWREHRCGVVARNIASDVLTLVNMSQEDVSQWLADAQADYDSCLGRFSDQCKLLREMHDRIQAKERSLAADSTVQKAIAAASSGGKTTYRLGAGPTLALAVKKLEHEEEVLKQIQGKKG